MKQEDAVEAIERIARKVDGSVRTDYSGRFMYGELCYGIDCDNDVTVIELAGAEGLRGAKVDNMGKGYIVYWPSVKGVPEEVEDGSNG